MNSDDVWAICIFLGFFLLIAVMRAVLAHQEGLPWFWGQAAEVERRSGREFPGVAVNPVVAVEQQQIEASYVTQQAIVDWLPAGIRADFEDHGTAHVEAVVVSRPTLSRRTACQEGYHVQQFGKRDCVMCGDEL